MRSLPTAAELLAVIADYLRETVAAKLDAPDDFYVRVAANSLDVVRREILHGPMADAAAAERLRALLGADGPLAELDAKLSTAIAAGVLPTGSDELRRHLLRTTLDEVAIDQPRYATYRRLMEQPPGDGN